MLSKYLPGLYDVEDERAGQQVTVTLQPPVRREGDEALGVPSGAFAPGPGVPAGNQRLYSGVVSCSLLSATVQWCGADLTRLSSQSLGCK